MGFVKTLFQKIANREIPATFVYEDELCAAIPDIHPQAPVHLLVFPKNLLRLTSATPADEALLGHLLFVAQKVAQEASLDKGFRIVINQGPLAGETVPHIHLHILGNRPLHWPPG